MIVQERVDNHTCTGLKCISGNFENLCPGSESLRWPPSGSHRAPSRYRPNIYTPSSGGLVPYTDSRKSINMQNGSAFYHAQLASA